MLGLRQGKSDPTENLLCFDCRLQNRKSLHLAAW